MSKVIRLSDDLLSKLDQVKAIELDRVSSDEDQVIFDLVFSDYQEVIQFLTNYYLISRQR